MTTTTGSQRSDTDAAALLSGALAGSGAAAIITDAPEPHPTMARTFAAMMAREGRVLRRNLIGTCTRAIMQPLLFVFVFTYVMPKIGGSGIFGGRAAAGGATFATILLPGLMASMLFMQGIMAVMFPLVMEFSWQRTIEDRALAPVPIQVLALQKIIAGAAQSFIGALILVAGSLLTSSLGLLLGTLMDPRKMQMLFAAILLPATMLGCVYYPWSALHSIRWLQVAVLVNPMV